MPTSVNQPFNVHPIHLKELALKAFYLLLFFLQDAGVQGKFQKTTTVLKKGRYFKTASCMSQVCMRSLTSPETHAEQQS